MYPSLGVSQSGRPPLPIPPGTQQQQQQQGHFRIPSGGFASSSYPPSPSIQSYAGPPAFQQPYNGYGRLSVNGGQDFQYQNQQQQQPQQPALRQSVRGPTPVLPPLPPEYLEEQQRLLQSRTPSIISPKPQHLPSFIPAGRLESQASEVGSVEPYRIGHARSSSLQSQNLSNQNGQFSSSSKPNRNSFIQGPQNMASIPHSYSMPLGQMSSLSLDNRQAPSGSRSSHLSATTNNDRRVSSAASSNPRQSTSAEGPPQLPPMALPRHSLLGQAPSNLPLRPSSTDPVMQHARRDASMSSMRHSRAATDIGSSRLAKNLPSEDNLGALRSAAQQSPDPGKKVQFAKEVFKYLERNQSGTTIADPKMIAWVDEAVKIVLNFSSSMPPVPEAMYLKADLAMSGTFPTMIPKNPKAAFRDLESAANAEFAPAWYRIGREYETFNDLGRAKEAYERGAALGDVTSTYRLGMAHLLGQLALSPDRGVGLDYLHTSALIAEQVGDTDTAAPLYVWAMILGGEFEAPNVSPDSLPKNVVEAGRFMQKAAYLCHVTAQFKMGWAYEHAQLGCPFDPFMSVQYYTLASQQGDTESDMSLSKWFLCGAEGSFSANEDLAYSFAAKAAKKGLASAEFAMGELGIGTQKNPQSAQQWYEKASAHGNDDAKNRLKMLMAGNASISRTEHESNAAALVRKRTQARIKSDAENRSAIAPTVTPTPSQDLDRKQTLKRAQQVAKQDQSPNHHSSNPRASADVKRFTLSDGGSTNSSGPPQRRSNQQANPEVVLTSGPSKGPATFAEMGIPTTNIEKNDCIIS